MKLVLATLYPGHLNLNGDQANLDIIKKRLGWAGIECELIEIGKGRRIEKNVDLIFIGHGSVAAWRDLEAELQDRIPELETLVASGVALMVVASGHDWAIGAGFFDHKLSSVPRVSKFEIANLGELEILGYLNSATDAPVIEKKGLLLGTQLHGPIFAKNPNLVDQYVGEIIESKFGPEGREQYQPSSNQNAEIVSGIVSKVWELERELASE